jgi:hypothetical protein
VCSALLGVIFCLDFHFFIFVLLFPWQVFFLYLVIYLVLSFFPFPNWVFASYVCPLGIDYVLLAYNPPNGVSL